MFRIFILNFVLLLSSKTYADQYIVEKVVNSLKHKYEVSDFDPNTLDQPIMTYIMVAKSYQFNFNDYYSIGFVSHFEDDFTIFLIPTARFSESDSRISSKLLRLEEVFWGYVDNHIPSDMLAGRRGGVNNLSITLVGDDEDRIKILQRLLAEVKRIFSPIRK